MATKRSRRMLGIPVLVGLAVLVLNLALGLLYRDSRHSLEAELARRLENAAAVLGTALDAGLVERARLEYESFLVRGAPPESLLVAPAYDSLRTLLRDIADHSELANVRVFDDRGAGIVDLAAGSLLGYAPEALDPAGVFAALSGSNAHSDLYQSGTEYLMAGYAPVRGADGVPIAAVAVEGDARFFAALRRLRFAMAASAALSVLVLIGLGLTFARLQNSLWRAEAAVLHAERLAAMGRMAAGIAHEIRNPLGIIKATNARLRKRYDDPAQPNERFAYIDEEVDRLNGILTGYLQFARDEPPQLQPLDLVPLVERGLRLARPELETAGVDVTLDLPASCRVLGDPQRLQQVVLNLVLNAVQAMPEGGRLRVHMTTESNTAQITFADSGPGFASAVRARLFEPFVTTKEKGSGLGLAVAQRIIEQHGGSIRVRDATPGGAQVEILLPIDTQAADFTAASSQAEGGPQSEPAPQLEHGRASELGSQAEHGRPPEHGPAPESRGRP
jgi:signal transduction histidine kinase